VQKGLQALGPMPCSPILNHGAPSARSVSSAIVAKGGCWAKVGQVSAELRNQDGAVGFDERSTASGQGLPEEQF
jgi:hypothetical protein